MIKAEVVFNGDEIRINDKLIEFVMGAKFDYWQIEGIAEVFKTLEEAIKYCLEQSNES